MLSPEQLSIARPENPCCSNHRNVHENSSQGRVPGAAGRHQLAKDAPGLWGQLLRSSTCLLAWLLLVTSQRLTGDFPPLQQWGQQVRNFENAGEKRRTC